MNKPSMTHHEVMAQETGKVNHLGRYIPAGLHKCQLCQTYDDPRRVEIRLENHKHLNICWTCATPHLLPFLKTVFTDDELDEACDQSGAAFPRNPHFRKSEPPQLPANHPKVLQEKANAANNTLLGVPESGDCPLELGSIEPQSERTA